MEGGRQWTKEEEGVGVKPREAPPMGVFLHPTEGSATCQGAPAPAGLPSRFFHGEEEEQEEEDESHRGISFGPPLLVACPIPTRFPSCDSFSFFPQTKTKLWWGWQGWGWG